MGRGSSTNIGTENLRTVTSQHHPHDSKHHLHHGEIRLDKERPDWVVNINKNLEEGHTYDSGRSWTIYRVPTGLVEVQKTAFVPKVISIGPFYHGDKRFKAMEEHKMRLLVRMLGGKFERNGDATTMVVEGAGHEDGGGGHGKRSMLLNDLSRAMQKLEGRTRDCYSESCKLGSNEFVRMMVVDGCFVVGLLHLYHKSKQEQVEDPIFTTPWMLRTLQRDLIMLENQLPYFVLEELFNLTSADDQNVPLKELIVTFFDPLFPRKDPTSKLNTDSEAYHMLDIFRSTFLTTARTKFKLMESANWQDDDSIPLVEHRQLLHSATDLEDAGIEFKKNEGVDMLDIKYHERTLQIAPLSLDDNAVLLFLNFLAYEQCDKLSRPFFTNFFVFFDSLIIGVKDIQTLHKYGILNHTLGSDENVASLISRLCRQMVYDLDQFYLSPEAKKVNRDCKVYIESAQRQWWRNLIRTYFSSPWAFLSLAAAILLLVLTITSTFYTVYAYYRPPA